jgi:hypothetical protein
MPSISGLPTVPVRRLREILEAANRILQYIPKHEDHQRGGVFCIADSTTGLPIFLCLFGCLTEEELTAYMAFAMEKAKRLAAHSDHFSSWESRELQATPARYGGAIRTGHFILSFSGFNEEQDEAAMLVLALRTGELDDDQAARIAHLSNNPYFRDLEIACALETERNPLDRFQFVDEKHP